MNARKAIYVNKGFSRYINGVPRDESDGILRYLYEHMANPLFHFFFLLRRHPPRSTLFPYTTVFRSSTCLKLQKEVNLGLNRKEIHSFLVMQLPVIILSLLVIAQTV